MVGKRDWKIGDRVDPPKKEDGASPPERLVRADGKATRSELAPDPKKPERAAPPEGRFEEVVTRQQALAASRAAAGMDARGGEDDGTGRLPDRVAKKKAKRGDKAASRASAQALIAAGDVRAPALIRRCETVGAKHALSPLAETPLGRALLLKMITEGQYRAGVQFEAVVQIYRMTQGLGSGHPVAIDITGAGGISLGGRTFEEGEIQAVKGRYGRAFQALGGAGSAAHRVTVDVVMRGASVSDETLHALRTGLNALVTYFDRGHRPQRALVWNPAGKVSIDPAFWTDPDDSQVAGIKQSGTPSDIAGKSSRKPGA